MVDKAALLDALAQGGSRAAAQYQQTQAALQAQQQQGIQGALAQAAQAQAPQGAAAQLASIQNAGTDARLAQTRANQAATSQWFDANRKASDSFLSTQGMLEKQFADQWLKDHAPSGGGGGSGSGSGSGNGSGDTGVQNIGDIIKQIRADAGLKGTGLTAAKYTQQYLADLTKSDPAYAGMPRDLRAQQYAMDHYGLPSEFLDAVAPVGGFLKQMQTDMQKARTGKLSAYDPSIGKNRKVVTPEDFLAYMHWMATQTPGDQSKAVAYLKNQIKGRSSAPAPAKKPSPLKGAFLW